MQGFNFTNDPSTLHNKLRLNTKIKLLALSAYENFSYLEDSELRQQ